MKTTAREPSRALGGLHPSGPCNHSDDEDAVVRRYEHAVSRLADKLRNGHPEWTAEMDDLVQSGMVGLIEAARRFEPDGGCPFWAFACHRVFGRITETGVRSVSLVGGPFAAKLLADVFSHELAGGSTSAVTPAELAHLYTRRKVARRVKTLSARLPDASPADLSDLAERAVAAAGQRLSTAAAAGLLGMAEPPVRLDDLPEDVIPSCPGPGDSVLAGVDFLKAESRLRWCLDMSGLPELWRASDPKAAAALHRFLLWLTSSDHLDRALADVLADAGLRDALHSWLVARSALDESPEALRRNCPFGLLHGSKVFLCNRSEAGWT